MTEQRQNITQEEAIVLANSKFWKHLTYQEIAEFQLFNDRLCMPFDVFHEAMEKALGRSVWTHEFADSESLRAELFGERPAPTFEEICNLIPADKRILLFIDQHPKGA
jgi:hypothetical protein